MTPTEIAHSLIPWLLDGDVALQYQVHRDLLGQERPDLRARIAAEGWGAQFLAARQPAGHWGRGFYQPKWTSTHYSLLDLRHLCIAPDHALVRESVAYVLTHHKGADGGVNPSRSIPQSDICICGMALNYACYFGAPPELLASVVDFVCDEGADSRLATAGYRFYAGESVEFAQASALAVGFVTGLVLRWPSG